MDIVGPNWFERLRFGEVQKYRDTQRLSRQGGSLVPPVPSIIARFKSAAHACGNPWCDSTRRPIRFPAACIQDSKDYQPADARR